MQTGLSRRYFLQVLGAGAAGAAGVFACSGNGGGGDPVAFGEVNAGNVSALQVGSVKSVPGEPVFIGRDESGLYAMTTTCTHQGCDMSASSSITSEIQCSCHGSRFDLNGKVLQGPASRSLAHFDISLAADGTITVNGGAQVNASTRTAVA